MNFEDFCYRSAILGQPLHTYVDLYNLGLWLNMFLIPLESDKDNVGYCVYSYDVAQKADSDIMSGLSLQTSSAVLKTCIKLRGTDDFQTSVDEVIADIREICGANRCCIFLLDRGIFGDFASGMASRPHRPLRGPRRPYAIKHRTQTILYCISRKNARSYFLPALPALSLTISPA